MRYSRCRVCGAAARDRMDRRPRAMNAPILLIVFNRPVTTIKVLEAIRAAKPKRLYIAADGPRDITDKVKCNQVRQIAKAIDWKCEVKRLYRETNLGCRYGPSTAIS